MNNVKQVAGLLSEYGRNGDTMLAHITPEEASLLKSLGGSGTINPVTGLPEFWGFSIGPVKVGSSGVSVGSTKVPVVSDVVKAASNVGSKVVEETKSTASSVAKEVKSTGSSINKFVKEEIPGGYATLAALAGAYYYGLPGFGEAALSPAELQFVAADSAQLAAQGLSTAQIGQVLGASGVPAGLAESVATLAGMGLPEAEIIANIGKTIPLSQVGNASNLFSLKNATDALKITNMLGGGQQPQQAPNMLAQAQQATQGSAYEPSNLLAQPGVSTTGLLGTQFAPVSPNLYELMLAQKLTNKDSLLG